MTRKWLVYGMLAVNSMLYAQTPWPAVQADNYPRAAGMQLIRHDQSILLGEASQQTGLFFATLPGAHTAQVQTQLSEDALRKGWRLSTAMRYGTQFVLTFAKESRILDIRLSNSPQGVDAVYSVVLAQQKAPSAAPLSVSAAPVSESPAAADAKR